MCQHPAGASEGNTTNIGTGSEDIAKLEVNIGSSPAFHDFGCALWGSRDIHVTSAEPWLNTPPLEMDHSRDVLAREL